MHDLFDFFKEEDLFSTKKVQDYKNYIENLEGKYQKYNVEFIEYGCCNRWFKRKETINLAYNRCFSYLDKCFKKVFPLKGEFNGRLWELFICGFFLEKGFIPQNKKEKGTPDFLLKYENKNIWIECVMPKRNETIERLGNENYKLDEISNPRYIRLTQSFTEKSKKWNNTYLKNGVKEEDIFIIAINGDSIDAFSTDKGMLGPLYGFGLTQYDKNGNKSYQRLKDLEKHNGTFISHEFFLQTEYKHVSGVIFLQTGYHFKDDNMCVEREHFQFIPNENAKNKVPEGFIEKMDIYIPHPDDY